MRTRMPLSPPALQASINIRRYIFLFVSFLNIAICPLEWNLLSPKIEIDCRNMTKFLK